VYVCVSGIIKDNPDETLNLLMLAIQLVSNHAIVQAFI
jgi:hypothetical protein